MIKIKDMKNRKWINRLCVCLAMGWMAGMSVSAQDVVVKTNALYWATATPNLGFEFRLDDRWTLDISGGYNFWTFNEAKNRKWKHFKVMPEARYWFDKPFTGHFVGLHSGYTQYNLSAVPLPYDFAETKKHRYEGWATGAGLTYGYLWSLHPRWLLEASIGLGYAYARFDKYECPHCGDHLGKDSKHYVGPTRAAVSLIYVIK